MQLRTLPELDLLTGLIVAEAGSEPFTGQLAVACVVRNRVRDHRWPDTYRDVILQPEQFSCFNNLSHDTDLNKTIIDRYFTHYWSYEWWRGCRFAAFGILHNWVPDITRKANHYYAFKLIDAPGWAKDAEPTLKEGGHLFYEL